MQAGDLDSNGCPSVSCTNKRGLERGDRDYRTFCGNTGKGKVVGRAERLDVPANVEFKQAAFEDRDAGGNTTVYGLSLSFRDIDRIGKVCHGLSLAGMVRTLPDPGGSPRNAVLEDICIRHASAIDTERLFQDCPVIGRHGDLRQSIIG